MSEMEEARAALQKDPWIGAAMFDDSLVAEVLLRLSRAAAAAAAVEPAPLPQLRWGLRLPRSRQIHRASVLQSKKAEDCTDDDVARAGSPTTPLSWCGGSGSSSHSGSGGEACAESSRSGNPVVVSRNSADCGRSKIASDATPSSRLAAGRSRKRKTFTQLKEEEHLLLEERMELNKKLEGLQVARNDLSMKNENLKKLKMNLESQPPEESRVTSDSPPAKGGFVLPDLNLPAEDESAFLASTE